MGDAYATAFKLLTLGFSFIPSAGRRPAMSVWQFLKGR